MHALIRQVRRLTAAAFVVGAMGVLGPAAAQGPRAGGPPPGGGPAPAGPLRVFLDCEVGSYCRQDFFVLELPWLDFTRDRIDADVQVLVTRLETGGGGEELTIALLGRRRFAGRADTVVITTLPNAPEDQVRRQMADAMRVSLAPWAWRTPMGSKLRVVYEGEPKPKAVNERINDPWNFWTFTVGLYGFSNGESLYQSTSLNGELSARRITEKQKSNTGLYINSNESRFTLSDGSKFTNRIRSLVGFTRNVWSLGSHWSAGWVARYDYDEFRNTEFAVRAAPVLEYNVFPWAQATSRQLTLAYGPSIESFRYRDTTIFGLLRETRTRHVFTGNLSTRQSWGSSNITLRASQFLHDLSKSNLGLEGNLQLRVVKGLSLELFGGASRVRDQLFLAAGGLTNDQILVRQRALATSYSYWASVGLSYTFGSIYNTVVNPRIESFRAGPN
jgi:hypothetical protein